MLVFENYWLIETEMQIMQNNFMDKIEVRIAIVGLGYVGLPLLCLFSKSFDSWGFDINVNRLESLKMGIDLKNCVSCDELKYINTRNLTSKWNDIKNCDIFIVAAPTPIDERQQPDLSILTNICEHIGSIIKAGAVVVFESTVAPGTTEEIFVPIIEKKSGMELNKSFFVGYSPERINIGDITHTLKSVPKIVSASNDNTRRMLSSVYGTALGCKIVLASSIKVAEAAKVYENVQRDVLIALANQYSDYCKADGIDICEVTKCASTKWNFAEVYPGLVGGHCIGVDSYYLIDRCNTLGVSLPLLKCARSLNDELHKKVSDIIINVLGNNKRAKVLLLGIAYKPNIGDIRNSKVLQVISRISQSIEQVFMYDPLVCPADLPSEYTHRLLLNLPIETEWDLVITMVKHTAFNEVLASLNYKKQIALSDLL